MRPATVYESIGMAMEDCERILYLDGRCLGDAYIFGDFGWTHHPQAAAHRKSHRPRLTGYLSTRFCLLFLSETHLDTYELSDLTKI